MCGWRGFPSILGDIKKDALWSIEREQLTRNMAIYVQPIIYLFFTLFIIKNASCSYSRTNLFETPFSANERLKRKVSELDTSPGALEFMSQLREKYSDRDGRPTLNNDDDPTSVWCIMDRGRYRLDSTAELSYFRSCACGHLTG